MPELVASADAACSSTGPARAATGPVRGGLSDLDRSVLSDLDRSGRGDEDRGGLSDLERSGTGDQGSVQASLAHAAARLRAAGCESPRLDAELLLGEVLGMPRAQLLLSGREPLAAAQRARFERLLARRLAREPVAYILGRRAFRRLELAVDSRVLIPRPETELLVEVGLTLPAGWRVADVGTGSGAVALALADERPDLVLTGIDASAAALAVARENAERLGLGVRLVQADLLDDARYDAVLANLPYVEAGAALAAEIAEHEPPEALYGGADGLAVIRRLIARLGGRSAQTVRVVALEVGAGQAQAVLELLGAAGFTCSQVHRDLAGHERVLTARRP